MAYNSTKEYLQLLNELRAYHVPKNILDSLSGYVKSIYLSEIENHFSEPMSWIGLYIAFASLVCILAMGADLVHGLRSRKLWFPCKYFSINSFYLTVISVAMKLPVDLTGLMPGLVDQVAKIGSMAFMCTMMANLLPCLATMDDKELYSNMAALSVLVITMVVNVCIQIKTGVVSTSTYNKDLRISPEHNVVSLPKSYTMLPTIYVTLLLVLWILYVCSCLAVLTSKKNIEVKYNMHHRDASHEMQHPSESLLTFEKLQEYVIKHWIMAGSGSSQFIFTGCFETTSASGVICVFVTILHILTMSWTFEAMLAKDYDSNYSWSMVVIVIVQLIGVMIGTIAPMCRCFAPVISFNVGSVYLNVLVIQGHWIVKLNGWKCASLGLPYQLLEAVIQTLKWLFLNLCIGFQVIVVVMCKIIAVSLYYFSICVKWLLKAMFSSSNNSNPEESLLIAQYILEPVYKTSVDRRTSEDLLTSVKQLVQKGENNQPYIEILEKSTSDFYGVGRLGGIDSFPDFLEYDNCWSLLVVTLATIACSLPEIEKNEVEILLRSVRGCLAYVMLVDESFKDTSHYTLKAVKVLWEEVHVNHKWLGNKLPDPSSQLNTAEQVVKWFRYTAIDTPDTTISITAKFIDKNHMEIFTTVMEVISLGILDLKNWDGDDVFASQQKLFDSLSSIIADTIAACFTNLPQVIINKCNPSVVEEREASVKRAALLLGETKQIIEKLRQHDIPNINPSDMPFFDKWYNYLRRDSP